MKEIIKIGDKEVTLDNSAAWLMEYQEQFSSDALTELIPLISSVTETIAAVVKNAEGGDVISTKSLAEAVEGDVFSKLIPLYQSKISTLVINITWAMAKAEDETIEPPKKWIRQFESFPLDTVGVAVVKLATKGLISSKNLTRLNEMVKSLKTKVQPK